MKIKFEELEMLNYLDATCSRRNIPAAITSALIVQQNQQYTRWRGVNFVRRDTQESQAIVYWRNTIGGDEEYTVEQFTAPDGTFYAVDDTLQVAGSGAKLSISGYDD